MGRLVGSQALARALNVSGETIRYQARKGHIPFVVTPGGHRRFDIDEVKVALGMEATKAEEAEVVSGDEATSQFAGVVIDIDLSEPHREMREEVKALFVMSAARDEAGVLHEHEKLNRMAPLALFVKEATVRYAPAKTFAGAGVGAR